MILEEVAVVELPKAGTVPPEFPHLIDNTMRADFVACPKKFYYAYIRQLGTLAPSVHLHAGGAFASGLETARRAFFEQHLDVDHSLKAGLEAVIKFYGPLQFEPTKNGDKSLDNVIRAYDSYFQRYPLDRDIIKPFILPNGKAMVEFRFSIPTQIKHPTTGNPILYGGRSDMIGVMHEQLWVTDEKTATQLGEQWSKQWDLESQFTGYAAAARVYGYQVAGALIRGVGLLKTKITHQECILSRSDWIIERWWQQLHRDIQRMVRCWNEGEWDLALAKSACSAYSECPFALLDKSPEPERWIEGNYKTRIWNPLDKDNGEKLLENPEVLKANTQPDLIIPGIDDVLQQALAAAEKK